MAETNTEKAKERADEVKEQMRKKSDQAEQKVKESVKRAESSRVGQHIPTSIDNMTFKDIIKITLFLNAVMTVGLYIIVSAGVVNAQPKLRYICLLVAKYIILIFGIGGILMDAVFFFAHLFGLFKIFLLLKAIKVVGTVILCFAQKLEAWHLVIMSCFYMICCVVLDLCFIYYLAIFQERMESDDYDENGMPKKDEGRKEQV